MDEEELHLCLCNSAPKALTRPKAETQTPEVVAFIPQPARGQILLWSGEDEIVPAHGIQSQLH